MCAKVKVAVALLVAVLVAAFLASVPGVANADTAGVTQSGQVRLAGPDRFATAVAASKRTFSAPLEAVFVASGENYPDALAAGPVAAYYGAPILLTPKNSLPSVVAAELARLKPAKVYLLGGTGVISDAVKSRVATAAHASVTRVAGPDRYATAAAIAGLGPSDTVYITSGETFADALAAGAAAARQSGVILLTKRGGLPAATRASLRKLYVPRIVVVGGPGAVPKVVISQIRSLKPKATITVYAGTDRYDTAARLARAVWPKGSDAVFHAPGSNFPDALAGTPAARANDAPLLLTRGTCAPAPTAAVVAQFTPSLQVALGGPGVTYLGVRTCAGPGQPVPKVPTTTTGWSTAPVTLETGISQPVSVRVKTGDRYVSRRVLLQVRGAPGRDGWNIDRGESWFTLESVMTGSDGWYRGRVVGNAFGTDVYRVLVPETSTAAWTTTDPLPVTQSGIGWADAKTVRPRLGGLQSISCPTMSFCAAVDERGYAVTFTGKGWTKPVALETGGLLKGVSCASASFCLAVSYSDRVYRFNGTAWAATTAPKSSGLTAVECPSTSFCAAISGGVAHVFNGTSWVTSTYFGDVGLASISCPSPSFCAVLDRHGSVATFDGKTSKWSGFVPTAPERRNAQAISCSSTVFCAVTDYTGKVNTFDGAAWSTPVTVAGLKTFSSLSCPDVGWCVSFTAGNVAVLSDGAWSRSASVFAGNAQVDCVAAGSCVAVDAQKASTLAGGSWSQPVMADPVTGTGQDISCVTSSFCFAVDSHGGLSRWGGSSWSAPRFLAGDGGLRSVSCVTTTFCLAVGPAQSFVFDGATWRPVPTTGPLRAVSCASPTFCAAIHDSDYLQTFNGTAWTRLRIVASATLMADLSCPSAAFCAVADASGRLYTFDGVTVSKPTSFQDQPLGAVSCSSSTMCVAIGSGAARYDGSRWTLTEPSVRPEAITCPADGFCLVVNRFGQAAAYDGSRWSMPMKVLEKFGALDAVECPDRSFCVALGNTWDSILSVTGRRV